MMTQTDRLHFLISYMQQEKNIEQSVPDSFNERFEVFRGLANERPAVKISREFLDVQDAFLSEYNARNVTEFESLKDWKSIRLNSSHVSISYAVFCLKR